MLRRLFVVVLLCALTIHGASGAVAAQENMATVHGTIYDFWSYTPLENVEIKVYSGSTLHSTVISTNGNYSLSLQPGSYEIVARYYQRMTLVYDDDENITLQQNDNVALDMIMFPAEIDENSDNLDIMPDLDETGAALPWLGIAIGLIIFVIGVVVFYNRKIMGMIEKETSAPHATRVVGVPEELQAVLDIIKAGGGRMNQLELRQKLPWSEAKVSLMISDLEDRGLVRKIRKGRANIIVLKD
jgi:uncharacterized membrane protein